MCFLNGTFCISLLKIKFLTLKVPWNGNNKYLLCLWWFSLALRVWAKIISKQTKSTVFWNKKQTRWLFKVAWNLRRMSPFAGQNLPFPVQIYISNFSETEILRLVVKLKLKHVPGREVLKFYRYWNSLPVFG